MFFEGLDQCLYPANQIARVGPAKDAQVLVTLLDGCEIMAWEFSIDRLWGQPVAAFEAKPETYVICESDDPSGIWKTPVIGWVVTARGQALPITTNGVNDGDPLGEVYTLLPNGNVGSSAGGEFRDLDEWRSRSTSIG